jgi:hypothetical protein
MAVYVTDLQMATVQQRLVSWPALFLYPQLTPILRPPDAPPVASTFSL